MENKEDIKVMLTPEQAKSVLLDDESIHTFRSGRGIMIGADWSRKSILEAIDNNADKIEIGGPGCKRTGHGLVVWTSDTDPLFIECNKAKLEALETELLKQLES